MNSHCILKFKNNKDPVIRRDSSVSMLSMLKTRKLKKAGGY